MTLPDDPREALRELAAYIRTARVDRGRMVTSDEPPREELGYWQTTEWFEGLAQLSAEADRVAAAAGASVQPEIRREAARLEIPL